MASPQPPAGFGPWMPLEDAVEALPRAPGVLQVKVAEGLLDYPRGRSAMVLYAGAEDLAGWLAASGGALARCAADRGIGAPLRVRFQAGPEPARAVAELLGRFVARFGAPPRCQTVSATH